MRSVLRIALAVAACAILFAQPVAASPVYDAPTCAPQTGPGIPAPADVATGFPGFHAAWYGQSGNPRLCAAQLATLTIAYLNTGSEGWYGNARLGTSGPTAGSESAAVLGGDGANGSPRTEWTSPERAASQPVPYVAPGQIAWFSFTIRAPQEPGWYRLHVRPVIEGVEWLEDEGARWDVVVLSPDGVEPPEPAPARANSIARGASSVASTSSTRITGSWYGPGFYGNLTACGQIYSSTILGVAHRTLPCGTPITLRYGATTLTVPVIDRGPYVYDREFDLSSATRLALGCPDLCPLDWLR
jgi:hypothetical protein